MLIRRSFDMACFGISTYHRHEPLLISALVAVRPEPSRTSGMCESIILRSFEPPPSLFMACFPDAEISFKLRSAKGIRISLWEFGAEDAIRESATQGVIRESATQGVARESASQGVIRESATQGVIREAGAQGVIREAGAQAARGTV